jgi:hypothetical protein
MKMLLSYILHNIPLQQLLQSKMQIILTKLFDTISASRETFYTKKEGKE